MNKPDYSRTEEPLSFDRSNYAWMPQKDAMKTILEEREPACTRSVHVEQELNGGNQTRDGATARNGINPPS